MNTGQQRLNEHYYSRRLINDYIKEELDNNPENADKVHQGVALLKQWLDQDYYESKNIRLQQLEPLCLEDMVKDIFVSIAYCKAPTLFVSVTAQLATHIGFSEHRDSIMTVAEIVAVLAHTDAFDIKKETVKASLTVTNRLALSDSLIAMMDDSLYLPPMVCRPMLVESNYESGYLTHNDSLILGQGNSHAEDICLDVINIQNQMCLQLDIAFLEAVPEIPTSELDTTEKIQHWHEYKRQCDDIYTMLVDQGNQFWLTHKVDKRGRLYDQGYHVTTQGSPFKKACIELKHEEIVEGVPV